MLSASENSAADASELEESLRRCDFDFKKLVFVGETKATENGEPIILRNARVVTEGETLDAGAEIVYRVDDVFIETHQDGSYTLEKQNHRGSEYPMNCVAIDVGDVIEYLLTWRED
jgi:hypothetical protein